MAAASVEGLLRPALRSGGAGQTALGTLVGVIFLLGLRRQVRGRDVEVAGLRGAGVRHSLLVFVVLFVHSLPEGLAMGAAQASAVAGLSLFVLAAIALQNVPEGTAVAVPMAGAGFGKGAQFWAAVLTSAPQPIFPPRPIPGEDEGDEALAIGHWHASDDSARPMHVMSGQIRANAPQGRESRAGEVTPVIWLVQNGGQTRLPRTESAWLQIVAPRPLTDARTGGNVPQGRLSTQTQRRFISALRIMGWRAWPWVPPGRDESAMV